MSLKRQSSGSLLVILWLTLSLPQRSAAEELDPDRSEVERVDELVISGELFTHLRGVDAGGQRLSSFELSRAELGVQSTPHAPWGWELRLEALRSAGEASLMGVDGDSLVTRVKRAWGYYRLDGASWSLVTRAGLIPDVWHLKVMSAFPLRPIGPGQGEREGLQEPSDLGVSWTLSAHHQAIFMSVMNGEGRRYTEQNQGKDLLLGAHLSAPLLGQRAQLSVAYRDGSIGPASGRNHRLYGALTWRSSRVNVGVIGTYAWGYRDRPSREVLATQAWAQGWVIPERLGLFGLGERLLTQGQGPALSADRWTVGLSHTLYRRPSSERSGALNVSLFESVERQVGDELNSPIQGQGSLADIWTLMATLSVAWGPAPLHTEALSGVGLKDP